MHIQPTDWKRRYKNGSIILSSENEYRYIKSDNLPFYLSDKEVIMIILGKIRIKPPIVQR